MDKDGELIDLFTFFIQLLWSILQCKWMCMLLMLLFRIEHKYQHLSLANLNFFLFYRQYLLQGQIQ
jgi:hypothetical protein